MESRTDAPNSARTLAARFHINQRTLQVAPGRPVDPGRAAQVPAEPFKARLRLQRHPADGRRSAHAVGSTISHMANFLSHEATMWVAVFGLIEIGIGVGLLFRRTVKAGPRSLVHLGRRDLHLRRGTRHGAHRRHVAAAGCAGAVCFYVLLGLMVWPKSGREMPNSVRRASSRRPLPTAFSVRTGS